MTFDTTTHKCLAYWLAHTLWAFPTFVYGWVVALVMLISGHRPKSYGYSLYFETRWLKHCGFAAGPFFVLATDSVNQSMKQHEYGHTLQTLCWGPLALFVITIPSIIRYHYRRFVQARMQKRLNKKKITSAEYSLWLSQFPAYDSVWFEAQATKLGALAFQE